MTSNDKDNHNDKNDDPDPKRRDYELAGEAVRIFQRGGTWHANVQHQGKQRRQSLKTRSKKEARRRALRIEAALLEGRFERSVASSTIAAAIEKYKESLRAERRADKTLTRYQNVFDKLLELAGRLRISKLSRVDLKLTDAYRAERAAESAATTVYNETVVIKQLLNFAVSRNMLAANPLKKMKLRKPKVRRQPFWVKEELEKILGASREPQRLDADHLGRDRDAGWRDEVLDLARR